MKCPTCDTTVEPGIAYCPNCGTRLASPSSAGAHTVLLPDLPAEQPASGAAEGQTVLLRDVPLPPTNPRGTQPLDPRVPPASQPGSFGLPPVPSSYEPPYTIPASSPQPYTPSATPPPYTPNQSYQPYQPPISQMPVSVPTSTAAVISLVFGILSWSFLPVISPFVAVIAGHMARREIREAQGLKGGNGLAIVGLILGYLSLALLLLLCVLFAIGIAVDR